MSNYKYSGLVRLTTDSFVAHYTELNQLALDDYLSTFEKGQKVVATKTASTLNLPLDMVKKLLESSTKVGKKGRFYVKL